MSTGTVSRYLDNKGFGFITPDDGGKDVFVHSSEIKIDGVSMLTAGQRVQYDVATDPKGPKARNVTAAQKA